MKSKEKKIKKNFLLKNSQKKDLAKGQAFFVFVVNQAHPGGHNGLTMGMVMALGPKGLGPIDQFGPRGHLTFKRP
jgi:hypothetical protein